MTAVTLTEKVCPVILRGPLDDREILVFRHPLAGIQLVKGKLERPEAVEAGALRELAEESGIKDAVVTACFAPSSSIVPNQLWHFVAISASDLPDRWVHDAADDGGHRFEFFWWKLSEAATELWHHSFVRALGHISANLNPQLDTAEGVMALYGVRINEHRFDSLVELIADDAVFWFSDGSHVGIAAVRRAFEATWDRLRAKPTGSKMCAGLRPATRQPVASTDFAGAPRSMA
ncbi:NUDIX domain-containing protein [Devosia epidermidihirudinis]|uniref:NUDIX domain-containing protein n=1 Tax=Devosia epidermidihirudinis TaxID=1293439 RepID=UPI000AE8AD89|nr:NUDIX domain-containing protein [Devosia epidermidihirudinis]